MSCRAAFRKARDLSPLATGVVYFVAAALTLHFVGGGDGIAVLWPASGLALAILLMRTRGHAAIHVAAIATGSLAANLIFAGEVAVSLGYTLANIIEPITIIWLLKTVLGRRLSFSEPRDLLWFCIGAVAGCALGAVVATAFTLAPSVNFWLSWFSTDVLGILTVTPLTMIGAKAVRGERRDLHRMGEAAATFALIIAVSWAVFSQPGSPILFLPMFLVLIAAARLGPLGAAGGVLVVAIVSSFTFHIWVPAQMLFGNDDLAKSLYLQFYLLTLFAAALPIAALLASRDSVLEQLGEEKRLLELAEENADLGHWWLDVETETVRCSPGVFAIFGLEGDRPPQLAAAIEVYHPEDRSIVTEYIERAVADRKGFDFQARIVRPDGGIRHVRSRGEIDVNDSEDRLGLFGIVQDVTLQVSNEAAIIEARKRAEDAARRAKIIAETDQLTGIANRRRATAELVQQTLSARREDHPLSIALFDIDHFKSVNDTYGHHIGDEVLSRVASCAAKSIRSKDLVGRFGGEEFLIVLPDTDAQTALAIAERVRAAIEFDDAAPMVTVSVGIAQLTRGESGESLLQRADQALYVAKREGRNLLRLAA